MIKPYKALESAHYILAPQNSEAGYTREKTGSKFRGPEDYDLSVLSNLLLKASWYVLP